MFLWWGGKQCKLLIWVCTVSYGLSVWILSVTMVTSPIQAANYLSPHMTKYTQDLRCKDSDQPVHPLSMIRVHIQPPSLDTWRQLKAHAISKDSDQTARMHRLIWVFTGHRSLTAGFVVRWLIYMYTYLLSSRSRNHHLLSQVTSSYILSLPLNVTSCCKHCHLIVIDKVCITHLRWVDSSTTTLWTGLFTIAGCLISFYYYYSALDKILSTWVFWVFLPTNFSLNWV